MIEKPNLQTADTDGFGPAKRRRRPALSCVECRMRKVRCDRNKPCDACTRIRSATCTYRPHRPGIRSQSNESPEVSTALTRRGHSQEHDFAARPQSPRSVPMIEVDACTTNRAAPLRVQENRCSRHPEPSLDASSAETGTHSDSGSASVISSLLDRISTLEDKLASTHLADKPQREASEMSSAATGQFIKSKCTRVICFVTNARHTLTTYLLM